MERTGKGSFLKWLVLRSSSTLHATTWKHRPVFFSLFMTFWALFSNAWIHLTRFQYSGENWLDISAQTENPTPALILLCRSWNVWSTESAVEPWRSRRKIISSWSVCEGKKVFKSPCQGREKVRGSGVRVGADWSVRPVGRCTPLFQEEFYVKQWSLSAWVSLGHSVEGRRRILKPTPKLQFGAKPTHVSQAWLGAEGAILAALETLFLGGDCPHRGASKSACLLASYLTSVTLIIIYLAENVWTGSIDTQANLDHFDR